MKDYQVRMLVYTTTIVSADDELEAVDKALMDLDYASRQAKPYVELGVATNIKVDKMGMSKAEYRREKARKDSEEDIRYFAQLREEERDGEDNG